MCVHFIHSTACTYDGKVIKHKSLLFTHISRNIIGLLTLLTQCIVCMLTLRISRKYGEQAESTTLWARSAPPSALKVMSTKSSTAKSSKKNFNTIIQVKKTNTNM